MRGGPFQRKVFMGKTARKHFVGDGWNIRENQYEKDFSKVAESVFSLGNEYMGCRGCLEEGTSHPSLPGSYLNGIYEYARDKNATGYKGIATMTHYMVNACDLFGLELTVAGEKLDMARSRYSAYQRNLNMKTGLLSRSLVWHTQQGNIQLDFERFLDMEHCHRAYQRITLQSDSDCRVELKLKAHFEGLHWGNPSRFQPASVSDMGLECVTESTNQHVAVAFAASHPGVWEAAPRRVSRTVQLELKKAVPEVVTRIAVCVADKAGKLCLSWAEEECRLAWEEGVDAAAARCESYWADFWSRSDIIIEGDEENQQGIRFCIFQLQQTYHGADPTDNIGAKGLTGEAYSGHAFWDTETYCLPYYLFNNPTAARYLLEYRYSTLQKARQRARDLDCLGACYPIATLNGEEACTLWQHASLQIQPTTAVAYGIYHYMNVCGDTEFLYGHGIEMLVEICRFLATRGQWDGRGEHFGYYAVMGPDEFQMMVNHNTYTNYMAQKSFRYTLEVLSTMPSAQREALVTKVELLEEECKAWQRMADKMKILYDGESLLYEQHEGFYNLPHIDVDSIPDTEFPLYSHWSYDRIYRNDMIKQPDVLMFQLLYNSDFTKACKKANYEFYEPKCIHESSLSPSVHSILACEIGKLEEAVEFFAFATRMDLDDYNRNTHEGLHTTSISAAWLNIVYGFGGLRSDKELSLNPVLPKGWRAYSFSITVWGKPLKVTVREKQLLLESQTDTVIALKIYGKTCSIGKKLVIERETL